MFLDVTRFALPAVLASVLVAPALAQFEVAPDHFDGGAQKATTATAHPGPVTAKAHRPHSVQIARATGSHGADRSAPISVTQQSDEINKQMVRQHAELADYDAQLHAQASALEAAWQTLESGQIEDSGQVDAVLFEQSQLEQLQTTLVPRIRNCELTLAQLESELRAVTSPGQTLAGNSVSAPQGQRIRPVSSTSVKQASFVAPAQVFTAR